MMRRRRRRKGRRKTRTLVLPIAQFPLSCIPGKKEPAPPYLGEVGKKTKNTGLEALAPSSKHDKHITFERPHLLNKSIRKRGGETMH